MIKNLYILCSADNTVIAFVDTKKNLLTRLRRLHFSDYILYRSNSRNKREFSYYISTPGFFEMCPDFDFSLIKKNPLSKPVLVYRFFDDYDSYYLTFLDDKEFVELFVEPDYTLFSFNRGYTKVMPYGDVPSHFVNGDCLLCVKPN